MFKKVVFFVFSLGIVLPFESFSQETKSFVGDSSLGRAEACQTAKQKAELFNYPKTGDCSCSRNNLGNWVCQVDARK